jgi:amidophosphoribosyltransferase
MCGIIGVVSNQRVNQDIYDGLTIIQHRGQDAAGIMTSDGKRIHLRKSNGLVRDAVHEKHMLKLKGNIGIGHVRYPTAGTQSISESQPFYVNSPYGLGIVHNGNLVNADILAQELLETDLRHLNTESDSEVLLNVLAYELQRVGGTQLATQSLFQAVKAVFQRVQGAYSAVALLHGYGLLAFRDPHGIRPLVYGCRGPADNREYMIASETIALDVLGFTLLGDVAPGEAVFIDLNGVLHKKQCVPASSLSPCIFEYIYLARPDSVIDNIPVYKARINMGKRLASKIKRNNMCDTIDVVIPIPDTSRTTALALAQALGVEYSEGFVKNRYIGRTFIMPGQAVRKNSVRLKLNAIKEEFKGKNILLVDDSIVRGTTSKEIIQMARDVGAKQVYFASAAPEVRYPNVYGIDMPTAEELIAYDRDHDEITRLIGADLLIYQDLQDVCLAINDAAKDKQYEIEQFETSIFTGKYIAGDISSHYLKMLSSRRCDQNKTA